METVLHKSKRCEESIKVGNERYTLSYLVTILIKNGHNLIERYC